MTEECYVCKRGSDRGYICEDCSGYQEYTNNYLRAIHAVLFAVLVELREAPEKGAGE